MSLADLKEALDAMKTAQGTPNNAAEPLGKAWTVGTGLVNYDLQAPALALYPFVSQMTMLRSEIPRVPGNGGDSTHWKAVTGINTGNTHPGISEGNRGAVIASAVTPYTLTYVGLGLEDTVTFEADWSAEQFDDARARASLGLLRSLMIQEEGMMLGGNRSLALGTTPTPTLSAGGSGATLPGAPTTYSVICVALTQQGYSRSSLASGVVGQISKTNADGTSDTINGGAAQKSAAATQAITLGQVLSCSVAAVEGAVAYAWFVGTAGAEKLEAITTINSVTFSAPLNGTRQAASALTAADYSRDQTYNYDGLMYQSTVANGATRKVLATGTPGTGSALTSDGAGGIIEINDVLQTMWDSYRLGPTDMLVNSQEVKNITKKIVGNGGAPLIRFAGDLTGNSTPLSGGMVVGTYLNPFTGMLIRIRTHPNMPAGKIYLYSLQIPYSLSGVGNIIQFKYRRDYYQIDWPLRKRTYEFGNYCDGVLQHYAPFSTASIENIANG